MLVYRGVPMDLVQTCAWELDSIGKGKRTRTSITPHTLPRDAFCTRWMREALVLAQALQKVVRNVVTQCPVNLMQVSHWRSSDWCFGSNRYTHAKTWWDRKRVSQRHKLARIFRIINDHLKFLPPLGQQWIINTTRGCTSVFPDMPGIGQ